MVLSGRAYLAASYPLSELKRTRQQTKGAAANDPKQTSEPRRAPTANDPKQTSDNAVAFFSFLEPIVAIAD
jgi:hypothetical protein